MQAKIYGILKSNVAIAVLATAVVTACVIYLTPLKHVNIISPAMNSMTPREFYEDYSKNPDEYIFIDVRSPGIYQSAHAKGSVNIPIENLYDEHYVLPKSGKKIALICTTGRLAAIAYGFLQYWGFNNLVHIQGGLENWTYEGLPIEGTNVKNIQMPEASADEHQ